jgi:ubiquinone/menaquinone biosynthesis C-methylase UbiE
MDSIRLAEEWRLNVNGAVTHERRFSGAPDRLRAADRIARLDVPNVVTLALEGVTPRNALDVGTGTGVFAEAFAAAGLVVTGIDTSAELLAIAREYVPAGRFREAIAEQVPFGDASFDLVFLGHVLHEADDPLAALREAKRVARQRVAILEWPYREEPQGPPLAHRIAPEVVDRLAARAGLPQGEAVRLEHMDFYRFTL